MVRKRHGENVDDDHVGLAQSNVDDVFFVTTIFPSAVMLFCDNVHTLCALSRYAQCGACSAHSCRQLLLPSG